MVSLLKRCELSSLVVGRIGEHSHNVGSARALCWQPVRLVGVHCRPGSAGRVASLFASISIFVSASDVTFSEFPSVLPTGLKLNPEYINFIPT